ncbi:hypothetical protein QP446_03145 [Corynebacterium riegelii]|uniref:hypothetical protein n=1 Tax=Corynebacterium riegelii TaxID=156976 RepID=UPI00254B5383|nr:hypothetical protein [Corynebacterium riegelii]MDK7179762.1 hypothetical protein [Corynebacterium riegelii]
MQKPRASRARPGKRSASQANEYFDGHMEIQYPPRNQALAVTIDAITIAGKNNVPVTVIHHELSEDAPVFAAGSVDAKTLHTALQAVLHSNLAAVTDTTSWRTAVDTKVAVPGSSLVEFALGRPPPALTAAAGLFHPAPPNLQGSTPSRL